MSQPAHCRYFHIIVFYFILAPLPSGAIGFPSHTAVSAGGSQCNLSVPSLMNFGSYDFNAPDGTNKTLTSNLSVRCSGLPAGRRMIYCITLTPRRFPPNVGKQAALFNNYGGWVGTPFDENGRLWGNPQIGSGFPPSGIAGSANFSAAAQGIKLPFRTILYLAPPYPSIYALGLFQNSFTAQLYYNYANSSIADPQQLCSAAPPAGTLAATPQQMTVQVTATGSCTIKTVGAINFGKYLSLDKVPPVTGEIDVYCTKGIIYKLGLNDGQNAQNGKRAMKCQAPDTCGSSLIYYDIYQDAAGKQIWGNDSDNSVKYAADNSTQSYHPTARIYAGQNTPPAGAYRDTIIVTLQ